MRSIIAAAAALFGVDLSSQSDFTVVQTRKGPRIDQRIDAFTYIRHRPNMQRTISSMIMDGAPERPGFTSEKPLTKRQRRRQRGKS